MLSYLKPRFTYAAVDDDEYVDEPKHGPTTSSRSRNVLITTNFFSVLIVTVLFLSSIVSSWVVFFRLNEIPAQQQSTKVLTQSSVSCQEPPIRREWRTLSLVEKNEYVRAVRCLASKPSTLGINGTMYDDFPWVHKYTSSNTHASAPFLPWHRYYLHLYETALKKECSFRGDLPYWDWSLDWSEFEAAPVWNVESGLGGDGSGPESVGDGKCVTAGPFSDIEMTYYDGEEQPHCLSRGFPDKEELKNLGHLIRPEAIDHLMHEDRYDGFASKLEMRAHKFLSHSVRGDLSRFTGPNDPVFFLHHVNIDRLWWQWQQARAPERLTAYNGKANKDTVDAAQSLDDLDMGGLSKKVRVIDVMDSVGGQLCYSY